MSDDKKSRGLSVEQWDECRKRRLAGATWIDLGKSYGIRRQTIMRRAMREGWSRPKSVQTAQTAQGSAQAPGPTPAPRSNESRLNDKIIDLAAHRAVAKMESDGTLDEAARIMSLEFAAVTEIRATMTRAMKNYAGALERGEIEPAYLPGMRDKSQVMSDSMRTWHSFLASFREDLGRIKGHPTAPGGDAQGEVSKLEIEIIDPQKNGTTGEAT
jgi:hypothetical protein